MPPNPLYRRPLLTKEEKAALMVQATPKAFDIVAGVYTLPPEERATSFKTAVDLRAPGDADMIARWAAELRKRDPRLTPREALVKALARYLAASVIRTGVVFTLGEEAQREASVAGILPGLVGHVNPLGEWYSPVTDPLSDAYDTASDWVGDRYEDVKNGLDYMYTESGARAFVDGVLSVSMWLTDAIKDILCHPATSIIVGAACAVVAAYYSGGTAAPQAYAKGAAATKGACALVKEASSWIRKAHALIGSAAEQRAADIAAAEFDPHEFRLRVPEPGISRTRLPPDSRLVVQRSASYDNSAARRAQWRIIYLTEKRRREAADRRRLAALRQQGRSAARKAEYARKQARERAAQILRAETARTENLSNMLLAGALVVAGAIVINKKMGAA